MNHEERTANSQMEDVVMNECSENTAMLSRWLDYIRQQTLSVEVLREYIYIQYLYIHTNRQYYVSQRIRVIECMRKGGSRITDVQ